MRGFEAGQRGPRARRSDALTTGTLGISLPGSPQHDQLFEKVSDQLLEFCQVYEPSDDDGPVPTSQGEG